MPKSPAREPGDGTSTASSLAARANKPKSTDSIPGTRSGIDVALQTSHRIFFVHSSQRVALSELCGGDSLSWVEGGDRTWAALFDVTNFTPEQIEAAPKLADLIIPPQMGILNEATPGIVDVWPDRYSESTDGTTKTWCYRAAPGQSPWTPKTKASEILDCIRNTITPPTSTNTKSVAAAAARAAAAAVTAKPTNFVNPPLEAIAGVAANDAFGHSVLRVEVAPAHYCAFIAMCGRLGLQTRTKTEVPTGTLHVKIVAHESEGATESAILLLAHRLRTKLQKMYTNCIFLPIKRGPDRTNTPTRVFEANVMVNQNLCENDAFVETGQGMTATVTVSGARGASRTESRKAVADAIRQVEMGKPSALTTPTPTSVEVKKALTNTIQRLAPLRPDEPTVAAFSRVFLAAASSFKSLEDACRSIKRPSDIVSTDPDSAGVHARPHAQPADIELLEKTGLNEPAAIDVRQPPPGLSRSSTQRVTKKKKTDAPVGTTKHSRDTNSTAQRILKILQNAPTLSQAKGGRNYVSTSSAVRGNRSGQNNRRTTAAQR
jgi:hypothetical protein